MTRSDYIYHLGVLYKMAQVIRAEISKQEQTYGQPASLTPIELDRRDKTGKLIEKLVVQLYEDVAVSERARREAILRGDMEQCEFVFPEGSEVRQGQGSEGSQGRCFVNGKRKGK